jgi:hypothetical protein
VDLPTAKAAVDELLLEMGYTPIEEELEGDTRFAIIKYISLVTTPKTNITENIDLTASVLEEYLGKEEVIDGEVARQIKFAFYKEIEQNTKDQAFKDLFIEDEF